MALPWRSQDWSKTSLGEPCGWPVPLQVSLGILLNAGAPMVCLWGKERQFFYNDACAQLLPQALHPTATAQELSFPQAATWQPMLGAIEQVFTSGQPLSLEATGGTNPLTATHSWTYSPLWYEGQVAGVFATAVRVANTPDGPKTEVAMSDSEERFRHLANHLTQLAWMADASGWIYWYNKRWFDYTGTTLDTMQGWGWRQVHHPDHIERVVEKVSHCFAHGQSWEDTFPLRGKDGQYRWFLSRATPVRNAQGQVVRWVGTNTDVTELQDTEKALEKVTERLNMALRSARITLFNQDRDLCYTWVYNPTHHYSKYEIVGKRDEDLVSPEAAARLRRVKQQVLDTGGGQRVRVEVDQLHFDLTIDPIQDAQGDIVGLTCAAVDVSDKALLEAEHRQAEETLRKSEEQLRMAQRAAGAGLWDWDMITQQLTWSEEYYHLYGLEPTVAPSYKNWMASIVPADRQRVEQENREAIAQGKNLKSMFRILHPVDGQRWLMSIGQTFYDDDGQPLRMTGITINITEQKRFEQALIASEAIAITRAEELTALTETTPAAIWIAHDPECRTITANRMAHELMQTSSVTSATNVVSLGAATFPFKQCRKGQEIAPHDLPMRKAIRTRQAVVDEIEFVYADGTVRYIYGKAVPLYGQDGKVRGAIAGFTDITALKESEREREQLLQRERVAREEAEQANRLKDQFLAVLSHELRSPLNPILGWAKLLQTRSFTPDKMNQALATIERNAQLQAQLVDDLLDLARILRGKLHLNSLPVELAGVIESALETVKAAAAAKHLTLTTDLDPAVQALGDGARLQQIVCNLLSNAVKFTPNQGQITVRLQVVENQAEITVTDTGMGINAEFLPYLFESFRQEDISITRKHGGLGLGLAIVRQLVEAHGGTIQAHSPGEGQGATFVVRLPRLLGQRRDRPAAPKPQTDLDLTGLQIISVDDSADTREFLSVLLGQYGADVTTVSSATEALTTLQTTRADVLISDIGMPDIDGYSLIRQIRTLPAGQGGNLPAIALTAYARQEDRQKSLASGYQRHLTKPLDVEKLVYTIIELTQG